MPKFAVCDRSDIVWQIDTDDPALLPFPVHSGSGNVTSLAFTADQQLEMLSGVGNREIYKTTGPKKYELVYTEPLTPHAHLTKVRVRMISFGKERVYFSSFNTAQGAEQIFKIRYLENGIAVPYATIYPSQLTIPNPCHPSEELAVYMSGDFTFGNDDTLYLSTGNLSGSDNIKLECGIYKVDGAGPDEVTGNVERIYLGEGPITGLCYQDPQILYFLRNTNICSLDLETMTETELGPFPHQADWSDPFDIAYVGNGLNQSYYWTAFSFVYALLKSLASLVWTWAVAVVIGRMPIPPRPGDRKPG